MLSSSRMLSQCWRHLEMRASRTWQSGNCPTPTHAIATHYNGFQAIQTSQEMNCQKKWQIRELGAQGKTTQHPWRLQNRSLDKTRKKTGGMNGQEIAQEGPCLRIWQSQTQKTSQIKFKFISKFSEKSPTVCLGGKLEKQAHRRAVADRSWHKSYGRIQYQVPYFVPNIPKWIFIISIVLVGKTMIISIITSPLS